jgi:hypothetical protein
MVAAPAHGLPDWWPQLTIGELLPWKGCMFKLKAITPEGLLVLECVGVKQRRLGGRGKGR